MERTGTLLLLAPLCLLALGLTGARADTFKGRFGFGFGSGFGFGGKGVRVSLGGEEGEV